MSKRLTVEKVSDFELALRAGESSGLCLRRQVVLREGQPVWEIVHEGPHLFSGTWTIVDYVTRQPLAASSYLATSFRYGEDLTIRQFDSGQEWLFRRVDPDQDRWLLLTLASEVVLESAPPRPEAPGAWELRATGGVDPADLLPVVCLLAFDRLTSGRL